MTESEPEESVSPVDDAPSEDAHETTATPAVLTLDQLVSKIQGRYEADQRLRHHASHEVAALKESLSRLLPVLEPRYQPLDVFKPGGSGVPILLRDTYLRDERCVLKLPRPVQNREADLNKVLAGEAERLIEARHPNVVRILFADSIPNLDIPYYIMECVADPDDADVYLGKHPTVESLLEIIRGAVDALTYIHRLNVVHTDVKPANLFVDRQGRTILADFGFAKRVDTGDSKTGLVGGTTGFMHPEQVRLLDELSRSSVPADSDPNRRVTPSDERVSRERIKSYWDLYSLGITIFVLLSVLEERTPRAARDYAVRYLRLMAYRLVGQNLGFARENVRTTPRLDILETVFGLTAKDTKELQYESINEVQFDLEKLLGVRDLVREVPELERHQQQIIQASSTGPVPFTERVRAVVHTPEVRRLGTISQLGLVSLVYPTASHSRLEHTLGTFAMACRYVRALYNDPINPIFRQVMRVEDLEAVLLACLVHDIGHYPLAHDLEENEPRIFGHERLTKHLLTSRSTSYLAKLLASDASGWSVDPQRVVSILTAGDDPTSAAFRDSVLSAIIDGPVDADKLDYLIRDGENLRVAYGRGIDYDRIISSATVVMIPRKKGDHELNRFPSIGIHDKGRVAAESLAFARYAMYGAVYWHRTHRTLKAMLNAITGEALYAFSRDGEDVRSGWVTAMRDLLQSVVETPLQGQLTLVSEAESLGPVGSAWDGAFLDEGMERVLGWLESHSRESTGRLAEDLRNRRLYDRVFVTSEFRSPGLPWTIIRGVLGPRDSRDHDVWTRRRRFAQLIQEEVGKLVSVWNGEVAAGQTAVTPEKPEAFLAQSAIRPVLLVDYPTAKVGSRHALSFLFEREWRRPDGDAFEAIAADQSPIWRALAENYQTSLAKFRLYCDPDFSGLVSAVATRDQLEYLLAVALDRMEA